MDIEKYKKSMPRCKDCTGFGWGECKTAGENDVACEDFERKPKLTNADRIRQMTDEELAEMLLLSTCYFGCNKCKYHGKCKDKSCTEAAIGWLKQEADDNG